MMLSSQLEVVPAPLAGKGLTGHDMLNSNPAARHGYSKQHGTAQPRNGDGRFAHALIIRIQTPAKRTHEWPQHKTVDDLTERNFANKSIKRKRERHTCDRPLLDSCADLASAEQKSMHKREKRKDLNNPAVLLLGEVYLRFLIISLVLIPHLNITSVAVPHETGTTDLVVLKEVQTLQSATLRLCYSPSMSRDAPL